MSLPCDTHIIVVAKRPITVRTLSRARRESFFNAFSAEDVAACFDHGVSQVLSADGADDQGLWW